MYVKKFMLW